MTTPSPSASPPAPPPRRASHAPHAPKPGLPPSRRVTANASALPVRPSLAAASAAHATLARVRPRHPGRRRPPGRARPLRPSEVPPASTPRAILNGPKSRLRVRHGAPLRPTARFAPPVARPKAAHVRPARSSMSVIAARRCSPADHAAPTLLAKPPVNVGRPLRAAHAASPLRPPSVAALPASAGRRLPARRVSKPQRQAPGRSPHPSPAIARGLSSPAPPRKRRPAASRLHRRLQPPLPAAIRRSASPSCSPGPVSPHAARSSG